MAGFKAHNIRLDNGQATMPEMSWFIAESPWFLSAKRTLELVYGRELVDKRIADLGCLEGGYTVEFARLGMNALGLEVRQANFENCQKVKLGLSLDNLDFINDDVWNLPNYGQFDAIFCCGLLYHLDRPTEFIKMLAGVCSDVLIINTHFATARQSSAFPLSKNVVEHDGYRGRWYDEYPASEAHNVEQFTLSSWSNQKSFWLLKEELLQALHDSGFDCVYEQFDFLGGDIRGAMTSGFYSEQDRGMFIGIKSG